MTKSEQKQADKEKNELITALQGRITDAVMAGHDIMLLTLNESAQEFQQLGSGNEATMALGALSTVYEYCDDNDVEKLMYAIGILESTYKQDKAMKMSMH